LGAAVTGEQAKKLMHDRHEGMEDIGDAMKLLTRELKSHSPNMEKVREGSGTIARLAPQVTGWFPPGTGPDVGKTRAKAEIWQKPDDYVAKRTAFQQAAQAFNAAAQGSDLAAIRNAHGDLGKSCKACHDPYRAEESEHD
jgi:cytochrome c556